MDPDLWFSIDTSHHTFCIEFVTVDKRNEHCDTCLAYASRQTRDRVRLPRNGRLATQNMPGNARA